MFNGTTATDIVSWNGTTPSAITQGGMSGGVNALAFDTSGNVYVGGSFASAGGVANTSYIAKWNGSSWSALGTGMNGDVSALVYDSTNNVLYAGGTFTTAGGVTVNRVAKWNGTSWTALGTTGVSGTSAAVYALAMDSSGNNLYAGGNFTTAGGVTVSNIAKWNGSAWSVYWSAH